MTSLKVDSGCEILSEISLVNGIKDNSHTEWGELLVLYFSTRSWSLLLLSSFHDEKAKMVRGNKTSAISSAPRI